MTEIMRKKLTPFWISVLLAFLVFSPFLGEHWTHDSYMISQRGYDYSIEGLFNQGRVFSSYFLRLLEAVHMPCGVALTLSVGISLVVLCLASYIVYRMTVEYSIIDESNHLRYFAAVIASTGIFLNLFVIDTFLFYESAIMSLGALCAALSARFFLRGRWRDYICSILLLIAAVFCYQADIAYFLPIVILFLFAKREGFEPTLKRFLLAVIFCAIAMLLNYVFLRITASDDKRVVGDLSFQYNIKQCILTFRDFLVDTLKFTPKYVYFGFGVCFGALFIYDAIRRKSFSQFIPVVLALVSLAGGSMLVHLPMTYFYVMPRSAVALAGLVPIAALGTVIYTKHGDKLLIALCIVFSLFISQRQIDAQKNNYAANKLDDAELTLISDIVLNYEKKTGIEIKKLYFTDDPHPQYHRKNIGNYGDVTIRILAVPWVVHSRIETYLKRQLEAETMSKEDRSRLYSDNDWDRFNPEQIVFEGDAMYICNY